MALWLPRLGGGLNLQSDLVGHGHAAVSKLGA
jgi:hypothetical protein